VDSSRVDPAPVQPVRAGPVRGRRGARARWLIASLVTFVVLAISFGGFVLLAAGAATSALVGWVPPNSLAYVELRLDAPGDQRQNAANLISHFPGFADQSTLNQKLDEALDQLVGQVTNGRQNFTGTIKPWLGDSMALVGTRLPTSKTDKAGLWLISVRDPAGAQGWASGTLGTPSGSEEYAGIPLTLVSKDGDSIEYGVISNVLVIGDPDSVHAAIDTNGGGTFSGSTSFRGAESASPGDRLAFGFLDLTRIAEAAKAARPASSPSMPPEFAQLPAWAAITVRAESDALSATVALPPTNLAPVAANHSSILATRLPAGTIAAGEIHDLAALFSTITSTLRNSPTTQGSMAEVDAALQNLGGIDQLIGWMGDGSVALVPTDDQGGVGAGLVVKATDANTAADKLVQLRNLISIAGSQAGITPTEEIYNGTKITVIEVGDLLRLLAGEAGALIPPGPLQIAFAQKDDLVVAGIGVPFVKAILDTKSGSTLADQANYRSAIDRAGSSNTGQLYLDLAAAVELAIRNLPPADVAQFEKNTLPYLEPFRAFAAVGSAGDPNRVRFIVTVK
jgi:hypothetical protein